MAAVLTQKRPADGKQMQRMQLINKAGGSAAFGRWAEKNIKVYVKLFHEGKISKEVYAKAVDKMYKIIEKN